MTPKRDIPQSKLLEKPKDMRTTPYKKTIIFSPVGDLAQLDGFAKHVKSLGIDKEADFLFIYRQGLQYKDYGLSAVHMAEKVALGTSGCFFSGQTIGYELGYEVIVIADLDALLDCRQSFDQMVKIAKEKKMAVVPLSKSKEEKSYTKGYVTINQWNPIHRTVFERAGFVNPYNWKGGEDYEYILRLKKNKLLYQYTGGSAIHPKWGPTIYHKIIQREKYYPYVAGLLRGMLTASRSSKLQVLKYFVFYCYYYFFGVLFDDNDLIHTTAMAHKLGKIRIEKQKMKNDVFKIEKKHLTANFPEDSSRGLFIPISVIQLLILKKTASYTDEIILTEMRLSFLCSIIKAVAFCHFVCLERCCHTQSGAKKAHIYNLQIMLRILVVSKVFTIQF